MTHEHLVRTPTSTGNRRTWTLSYWIKRNCVSADQNPANTSGAFFNFYTTQASTPYEAVTNFNSNGTLQLARNQGGGDHELTTTNVFRDVDSWMHILLKFDTTDIRSSRRATLYVNGAIQDDVTGTFPSSNYLSSINWTVAHTIGTVLVSGVPYAPSGPAQEYFDWFLVDGQSLEPEVFGFYKDGKGYQSSGNYNSTDFRNGQWVPRNPREIKKLINASGGFGVNGIYLPMNDGSNAGADFHCDPNSIITLKGENLPQPRNGAPTTSDAFVSQLREEKGELGFDGVCKFDGVGDYLSLSKTNFQFLHKLTNSWTVEGWIYKTGLNAQATLFDTGGSSSTTIGTGLWIDFNNIPKFRMRQALSSVTVSINSSKAISPYSWNHIAVSYDQSSFKLFLNGELVGSASYNTQSSTDSTQSFKIGAYEYSGSTLGGELNGFISNLRVIEGTALYTSNFTVPTEPLTNVTNTKLLCCNSSTSATASTVTPGTITANGNVVASKNELTSSIVLAVPGASTSTSGNLVKNGSFDNNVDGWFPEESATLTVDKGRLRVLTTNTNYGSAKQIVTGLVIGKRYSFSIDMIYGDAAQVTAISGASPSINSGWQSADYKWKTSFTATTTSLEIDLQMASITNKFGFWDNVVLKQEDAPRDYSADIKGSGTNKTLTPNGQVGICYELGGHYGSAISSSAFGDYLDVGINSDWNFGSGDFTVEFWSYDTTYSTTPGHGVWDNANNQRSWLIYHNSSGLLRFFVSFDGATNNKSIQVATATPANQWNHYCMERVGSTLFGYVNGVCVGANNTLGTNSLFTPVDPLWIGRWGDGSYYVNGYTQDFRIYKGFAKYRGGFDISRPYSPIGIESWRTTQNSCKNKFATMTPLSYQTTGTPGTSFPRLSDGNLKVTHGTDGQWERSNASFGVGTGKWYFEYKCVQRPKFVSPDRSENWAIGVRESDSTVFHQCSDGYEDFGDHVYWMDGITQQSGAAPNQTAKIVSNEDRSRGSWIGIPIIEEGDIVNVAFEKTETTLKIWFGKNGIYFNNGNPNTGFNPAVNHQTTSQYIIPSVAFYVYAGVGQLEPSGVFNFGQNPAFAGHSEPGTLIDDSGKGVFKYQPPTGFLSMCVDNLPTPQIEDPGKYFKTQVWSGDSQFNRSITGIGFKPDLVWVKSRTSAVQNYLVDVVRGPGIAVRSDDSAAETEGLTTWLRSFDPDGFSVGSSSGWNGEGNNYIAWCWKAGGLPVQNHNGSITSEVSASTTAGFSIVNYVGTGSGETIGHGLGKKPKFILLKERYSPGSSNSDWQVYHSSLGAGQRLELNTTDPPSTTSNIWNNTEPTSDVFSIGSSGAVSESSGLYIAYCWTEIEGFSKIGNYRGNGNHDGPFVYCGFKPAFLLIKTNQTGQWILKSNHVATNPNGHTFLPDTTDTEYNPANTLIDFVSNGFKLKTTSALCNANTANHFYIAFAESPFKYANAK